MRNKEMLERNLPYRYKSAQAFKQVGYTVRLLPGGGLVLDKPQTNDMIGLVAPKLDTPLARAFESARVNTATLVT